MNTSDIKLTNKQISSLEDELTTRKPWNTRIHVVRAKIKSYGINISDDDLDYFMNVFIPSEVKRIKREHWIKVQTGVIKTNLTPTDVKGTFDKVENPIIGGKYHISWAFSGAVFVLKRLENGLAYLDNPKYKRKTLLTCKVSELRHCH